MFKTIIKTAGGARKETWVEELGVISFNPEGTQQNGIRNISIS